MTHTSSSFSKSKKKTIKDHAESHNYCGIILSHDEKRIKGERKQMGKGRNLNQRMRIRPPNDKKSHHLGCLPTRS